MVDIVLPRDVDILPLPLRHVRDRQFLHRLLVRVPLPVVPPQEVVHELLVEARGLHPRVGHDVELAPRGLRLGRRVAAADVVDLARTVGGEPGPGHEDEEGEGDGGGGAAQHGPPGVRRYRGRGPEEARKDGGRCCELAVVLQEWGGIRGA